MEYNPIYTCTHRDCSSSLQWHGKLKEKCQSRKANKFLSIKINQLPVVVMDTDAITEYDFLKIVQSIQLNSLE